VALEKIEQNTIPGAGITGIVVYLNAPAMKLQITLVQQVCSARVQIQGLTIGGGVLSIKVAKEYIQMTELIHLSVKPACMDTIQQVINVAQATSAQSHPASCMVVLRPHCCSVDFASGAFWASCTQVSHRIAPGVSGDPSQYWVPSGHMQLSNPASHPCRLQPQHHGISGFTTSPEYHPSLLGVRGPAPGSGSGISWHRTWS